MFDSSLGIIGIDVCYNVLSLILEEKGDQINPENYENDCLYTSQDDPTWHCIVGEFLEWVGIGAPADDVVCGFADLHDFGESWTREETDRVRHINSLFTEKANYFLSRAQRAADTGTNDGKTWEDSVNLDAIYDIIKEEEWPHG